MEGDPGGDTPGAVSLLQGSRASAEYKRVDRSLSEEGCPLGAGAQTGRVSKRGSCSYANACVPAPGTRGWDRSWCGLQAAFPHSLLLGLETPKRWEPKRRRRRTPRRAALGASQCQPARGATERAWQLGGLSPAGPRSPTLYPCLSFPICTGRCSGGLGTVPAPCWNPFIQAQGGVCLSEREGRQ